MKILELYKDFSIPHITEGHKHSREGWVNVECPFCTGNPGYHLGFNVDENYFHCWRCGGKQPVTVISKLLSVSHLKAEEIILEYGGIGRRPTSQKKTRVNLHPFKYPSGDLSITNVHKRYLESRGFDPDKLIKEWNLMGTGPSARLDGINYKNRILAPITWEGKTVSFQTRALTRKQDNTGIPKYLACPQPREIIEHQHILYGNPFGWGKRGICVEGITDVWRLGIHSFAVFGIQFTPQQVRHITKLFTEVVVFFDPDRTAQWQAKKLVSELNFRGTPAIQWNLDTVGIDPAELDQEIADEIINHLMHLKWN